MDSSAGIATNPTSEPTALPGSKKSSRVGHTPKTTTKIIGSTTTNAAALPKVLGNNAPEEKRTARVSDW